MRKCWLCGATSGALDRHHIFGGSNRKKSEKYGLMVDLCHDSCHIFGRYSAHQNKDTMLRLHQYGQRKAMEEQNWTVDDFVRVFGKNYLEDDDDDTE